jgi:murein DD-endopeptidase MepM/ murein hydrolase activator NlpD
MVGLSLPGVAAAVPQGFNPLQMSQALKQDAGLSQEVSRLEKMGPSRQPGEPVTRVYAAGVAPEPEATPPAAITEPPPIFTTYEVQTGDTVSSIAARFGLQPESIIWNNVDISDEDFLAVGQLLRIPATDGIIHEVRLDETLSDIAARYSVDLSAITTFTSNGIVKPDDIHEKQLVFVPGGTMPPPPEPKPAVAVEPAQPSGGDAAAPAGAPPAARSASSEGLIWPVTGPISSYMGPSHPLGIDIDQYASPNAPIYAATAGVVTFAGGDPCCSYGLHVILMSPGGIETLYAHMSSINVVQGQQVAQGEVLGYVGCTGYCTGNHLHFEVIDNGVRENPLDYLP